MWMLILYHTLIASELNIFQKKIKILIGNKIIKTNISRIQANDKKMCQCFCTGFIAFMLEGESLLDYTYLFSPNKYEKNDKIILTYFQ